MNIAERLVIPKWNEYFPHDLDYYSNVDRQDLLCRFKLSQVYQNFCVARMNFIFSEEGTDYGDVVQGENVTWYRKLLLQNSILYYNICVDLSWTMVYFYCVSKHDKDFNIDADEIKAIEESVTFDTLQEKLDEIISITSGEQRNILENLKTLTWDFFNKEMPENFRQDYNYIKHRGTFDVFCTNTDEVLMEIKNKIPNIVIPRPIDFDLDKIMERLERFHKSFFNYVEQIINLIIKPNYRPPVYSVEEIFSNTLENS